MFNRKILQVAVSLSLTAMSNFALANEMVNPNGGVVVGYWHNWCDGDGYAGGNAPCIDLEQVNPMYNVVNVSFMKVNSASDGRIPTFKLNPAIGLSEQEFINQVDEMNQQGRAVLIALGGADASISLKAGDERPFADEIIRITDFYGFDGLDIDLEQSAIFASDNQTVIPAALRIVKEHYRTQGKNFLITMAPEFPYLTQGGRYVPYIENLEGYYDWINPQFYNQGGDGLWVDGIGWIAQNNDALKREFIYYMSDSLSNGTRGFHRIAHDKLVFGIPANVDAAATGFITNPQDLYEAFDQLAAEGQPLRGVMTWSANWDMGTDSVGLPYREQFINDYGPYIHGQVPTPPASSEPIIKGVKGARVPHGSVFDPMFGVTAIDGEDGDLTDKITIEGQIDILTVGTYALTYRVQDSDANVTSKIRSVEVYSASPVFTGVTDTTVELGSAFAPMSGVMASDVEDGDLTSIIQVSGSVDTNAIGKYTLTYRVTDSAKQTTIAERKVTITDSSACAAPWDMNLVYIGGEQVMHGGKLWQAGWWTRSEEPGTTGQWGVWREVIDGGCGVSDDNSSGGNNNNDDNSDDDNSDDNDSGTCEAPWNVNSVYAKGEQVMRGGKLWQAGWWTRGEEPGTTGQWGVWREIVDGGCN